MLTLQWGGVIPTGMLSQASDGMFCDQHKPLAHCCFCPALSMTPALSPPGGVPSSNLLLHVSNEHCPEVAILLQYL